MEKSVLVKKMFRNGLNMSLPTTSKNQKDSPWSGKTLSGEEKV